MRVIATSTLWLRPDGNVDPDPIDGSFLICVNGTIYELEDAFGTRRIWISSAAPTVEFNGKADFGDWCLDGGSGVGEGLQANAYKNVGTKAANNWVNVGKTHNNA